MTTANFKVKIRRKRVGRHGRVEPCGTQNGLPKGKQHEKNSTGIFMRYAVFYERIMNGFAFGCAIS